MTNRKILLLFPLLLLLLSLGACASAQKVSLEQPFTLMEGQTVKVDGEPLQLTLNLVGREWRQGGEIPYIEMTVEQGRGQKEITVYLHDDYQIGDYTLRITRVDPFSQPPSCNVVILKR